MFGSSDFCFGNFNFSFFLGKWPSDTVVPMVFGIRALGVLLVESNSLAKVYLSKVFCYHFCMHKQKFPVHRSA